MWVLDSPGDFLDGRRVWLRPGRKYLFGRPPAIGVHRSISEKAKSVNSVSRQHITIEVSPVTPRDGTRTHTRTNLTVTDLKSKLGTTIDGELVKGEARVLSGTEHTLKLGKSAYPLRIKWEPVVLSFSFSSKEMRAEDPLAKVRSKLEDLDIKTIIPYLVDQTTHVVQNKRNTAKGLQALINGKLIVSNAFIDALVYATTPTDFENAEAMSPLEIDFDTAWPKAIEYLPPSRERAGDSSGRSICAESITDHPINNGHGKAVYFEIKDGATTAAEIVEFMNEVSGSKGIGSEREGPGGVVLVRFRSKGQHESWSIELGNEVALMTDQRVIEQREFLDAILGNDASPLCRPLPREASPEENTQPPNGPQRYPEPEPEPEPEPVPEPLNERPQRPHRTSNSPASQAPASEPMSQSQPPPSQPKAPRKFVSKMQNFDDGFDMESVPLHVSDDDDPAPVESPDEPTQRTSHARSQKVEAKIETEEDMVMDLLPGARAMKRHREETRTKRTAPAHAEPEPAPKRKRPKLDVLEAARKHREEEEQQRDAEEPDNRSQDVNIEGLRNLAIIEEMDLPLREMPVREEATSDRWDERWNGRKNFKRFRRKGEPRTRHRVQSVIVPLEEVTRKGYGIGEHYWSSNRKSPEQEQPPARTQPPEADEDPAPSRALSRSVASAAPSASPEPTPAPSIPSRTQSQKRPRSRRDSDSDEELRFRFRRKR
ncbi:hypothetical protein N7470_006804 [Penicillium chermesinum]|nr:hypothetical protein N7470_006804 [Penicillium chermesinum]